MSKPKKIKVVVYAISKNESKFVKRWIQSMKEADEIYVLDTGSTDDTVSLLEESGVHVVKKEIIPWRFDVARNESLNLVPQDTDICVCTDLDEVFESGWREKLESTWKNANRMRYTYNWSLSDEGKPKVSFLYEKIHDRTHYKWIHPVHEILECSLEHEVILTNESIVLNHYPDKEKSRSSYLPLLELSVEENPLNDRNMHYLGREYMYYGMWEKSIETLHQHLKLPTATWKEERAASMRFIARDYLHLNRIEEARLWYQLAILECPTMREGYVELAMLESNQGRDLEVIINLIKAKQIKKNEKIYINEPFCWNETIDDLLSISYHRLGIKDLALYHINKAIEVNPNEERLRKNKEIFENS